MAYKINIVGAGIFGVTAALELHQRGHDVHIFDPGPIPHPEASSTDITKMIRMDYGDDTLYFDMMEIAFQRWHQWNQDWGEDLYHQDGFLLMKKSAMAQGTFEHDSFEELTRRGQNPIRMDSELLAKNHPVWNASLYPDGYLNEYGGWAESGRVVEKIALKLRELGVAIHEGKAFDKFIEQDSKVKGIITSDGEQCESDYVIIAAGAWTPAILPELKDVMQTVGLPVIHFDPPNPDDFRSPAFRPWSADISNTGWYGFPLHPSGVVKIANHGSGIPMHPDDPKIVPQEWVDKTREFVQETFPALSDATVVKTRLCMYCDTFDGDFWIDHAPDHPGLVVASGGSGHGFKFAPVLGGIIADVLERKSNPFAYRFAWREKTTKKTEAARHA